MLHPIEGMIYDEFLYIIPNIVYQIFMMLLN